MRRPTRKKFNPEQKPRSESEEWHSIQLAAYTAIKQAEVTSYEFRDTPKGCRLFRVKVIPDLPIGIYHGRRRDQIKVGGQLA